MEGVLAGEFQLVFGDEEPLVHGGERVFDEGVVFAGAEQEADGRVVTVAHDVFLEPGDVGVELADVFVAELVHLQLDEHVAAEDAVIEDKIHEALLAAKQPFKELKDKFAEIPADVIDAVLV